MSERLHEHTLFCVRGGHEFTVLLPRVVRGQQAMRCLECNLTDTDLFPRNDALDAKEIGWYADNPPASRLEG